MTFSVDEYVRGLRRRARMQDVWAEQSIRRPFHWGVLIVGDAAADLDASLREHAATTASQHHVAIAVRHASDVNYDPEVPDDEPIPSFEVDVSCRILPIADNKTEFETVIDVPSGRISVGDTDGAICFEVTPGRWLLQVAREPADHPEHVVIELSPALLAIDDE